MAPLRQRQSISKDKFSAYFSTLRTIAYNDPSSRGVGSHGYVLLVSVILYMPQFAPASPQSYHVHTTIQFVELGSRFSLAIPSCKAIYVEYTQLIALKKSTAQFGVRLTTPQLAIHCLEPIGNVDSYRCGPDTSSVSPFHCLKGLLN